MRRGRRIIRAALAAMTAAALVPAGPGTAALAVELSGYEGTPAGSGTISPAEELSDYKEALAGSNVTILYEDGTTEEAFAGEEGETDAVNTSNETPVVYTTVELNSREDFEEFVRNCHYDGWSVDKAVVLNVDLDFGGEEFEPIASFGGIFDGQGHTLSGVSLTGAVDETGVFGTIQNTGVVRNLNVEGEIAPSGYQSTIGGIAGINYGTISNCTFSGDITAQSEAGGIAGRSGQYGIVIACSTEGTICASAGCGGIVGYNEGTISDCENGMEVNTVYEDTSASLDEISGALDTILQSGSLLNTGSLTSDSDIGGIAGFSSGVITSCINRGAVGYEHVGYNVGGIVGRSSGFLYNDVNYAEVYGRKDVGGIAGQMQPHLLLSFTEETLEELDAALDDFYSAVQSALDEADAYSTEVSNHLTNITGLLEIAEDSLADIADEAADGIDDASAQLEDAGERVRTALLIFSSVGAEFDDYMDGLGSALSGLGDLDLDLSDYLSTLGDSIDDLLADLAAVFPSGTLDLSGLNISESAQELVDLLGALEEAGSGGPDVSALADQLQSLLDSRESAEDDTAGGDGADSGNGTGEEEDDGGEGNSSGGRDSDAEDDTSGGEDPGAEDDTSGGEGSGAGDDTSGAEDSGAEDDTSGGEDSGDEDDSSGGGTGEEEDAGSEDDMSDADDAADGEDDAADGDNAADDDVMEEDDPSVEEDVSGGNDTMGEDSTAGGEDADAGDETSGGNDTADEDSAAGGDDADAGDKTSGGNGTADEIDTAVEGGGSGTDGGETVSFSLGGSGTAAPDAAGNEEAESPLSAGSSEAAEPDAAGEDVILQDVTGAASDASEANTDGQGSGDESLTQEELQTYLEKLQDYADSYSGLSDLSNRLQEAADSVDTSNLDAWLDGSSVESILSGVADTVDSLESSISEMSDIVHGYTIPSPDLSDLSDALDDAAAAIADTEDLTTDITAALNVLASIDLQLDGVSGTMRANGDTLYQSITQMTGEVEALNQAVSGAVGGTVDSLSAVVDRFDAVTDALMDSVEGLVNGDGEDDGDVFQDISDEEISETSDGRTTQCVNYGAVSADLNVGGIVGMMGVEYSLDPELDIESSGSSSLNVLMQASCIVDDCVNRGAVTARTSYAGGIAGHMELGLVAGCADYGDLEGSGAKYIGGITGYSAGTVRGCAVKCDISGGTYVGGIAGYGTRLRGNLAMVRVTEGEQYVGAVAGRVDSVDISAVSDNYYYSDESVGFSDSGELDGAVGSDEFSDSGESDSAGGSGGSGEADDAGESGGSGDSDGSDELYGIGGVSYQGIAEGVSYETLMAMEGLPDDFGDLVLTFRTAEEDSESGGEILGVLTCGYGGSIDEEDLPEIPEREGFYAAWSRTDYSCITADETVTAIYTRYVTLLTSDVVRENGLPAVEADGQFREGDVLGVTEEAAQDGELERWTVVIPDDGADTHQVRFLLPEDAGDGAVIWLIENGEKTQLETGTFSDYITFEVTGNKVTFAVGSTAAQSGRQGLRLLTAAGAALVLILAAALLLRRRGRRRAGK